MRFRKFVATLPWEVRWGCQMRVAGLNDAMLDVMRAAGCFMVSYGFESYSPIVLKSMKKHISPEQIHHAVHATLNKGISVQGNFIFGDRAETLETAKETLDFWKEHDSAGILLAFIGAYPNSEMYRDAIARGLIKDRLNFIKNHMFDTLNMTNLSDDEFEKIKVIVTKYAYLYYPYAFALNRTEDSVTTECPHCKKIIEYNNFKTFVSRKKMMYCRSCRKRFFVISRLNYIFTKIKGRIMNIHTYRADRKIKAFLRRTKTWIRGFFKKKTLS